MTEVVGGSLLAGEAPENTNRELRNPTLEEAGHSSPVTIDNHVPGDNETIEKPDLVGLHGTATSKNQLKKLKRKQEWEDARGERKVKRKQKIKEKKQRKRDAGNAEKSLNEGLSGLTNSLFNDDAEPAKKAHQRPTRVPVTFVIDCQFDDLMNDGERVSLAGQLTRSYSDNRKAKFQAHLAISSFGGKLKERFENVLNSHHANWPGVKFLEQDFVVAVERAKDWMRGPDGGAIAGALLRTPTGNQSTIEKEDTERNVESTGETVYLSSDSPETLSELKPYSIYIIGGLVDKNRHKGICYKRAMDRGIRTAKLPIGQFLQMQSRSVLTTNHVNEVMLKWLELGDWGEAFMQVIPKRKGGTLKNGVETKAPSTIDADVEEGDEEDGGVYLNRADRVVDEDVLNHDAIFKHSIAEGVHSLTYVKATEAPG